MEFTCNIPLENSVINKTYRLATVEDQHAALAKTLKVIAVQGLSGVVTVDKKGKLIKISGEVTATLTRQCVASLENFDEHIRDDFDFQLRITDAETAPENYDPNEGIELDLNEPDPHYENQLDVADILIQQVGLAMSPYPRKEGADNLLDDIATEKVSAFDALKALKND